MDDFREMSLKEWCDRLPKEHLVNIELRKVATALAFFNCMVLSGENHSDQSMKTFKEAMEILDGE